MNTDTIYALASGRGQSGIAIIRLSGSEAWSTAETLAGKRPIDRRVVLCQLRDPATTEILDEGLCIGFIGPNSYTGEDVIELHVHGGLAVIASLLDVLSLRPGLRLAEPGEFTRRAFENGRMDLTEAEAIGDLIKAETKAQRLQALRQGGGALARLCEDWRGQLIATLAHWEAALDFSEEELPTDIEAKVQSTVISLVDDISKNLNDNSAGELLRDGLQIAIIGPPNAGKSSLLNALAKRDVAIVSALAGTTRDVLEVHLDLNGYPVILADTAGVRDGGQAIEREGIRRALQQAAEADLKLAVFDVADWPEAYEAFSDLLNDACLIAVNKTDIKSREVRGEPQGPEIYSISAKTGAGLTSLIRAILAVAERGMGGHGQPIITRVRHREALQDCVVALRAFNSRSDWNQNPEIAGEHLRIAARALARVTGRMDIEDVLDVIFRDFCVGK